MPKKGKKVKGEITSISGKEGWEMALEKAKSSLYKNKLHRSRLMMAIRLFQEKIKKGEPWPTDQKASMETEAVSE
jgi:hypothetical protein